MHRSPVVIDVNLDSSSIRFTAGEGGVGEWGERGEWWGVDQTESGLGVKALERIGLREGLLL